MRIARTALAESVVQALGHGAVNVRHGRIVEVAADDAPRTPRLHHHRDAVHLRGTQHAVLAETARHAPQFVLARRIGEKSAAGEVVVVGRLDRRRTQVVVEHPDRIVADQQIGPDRGAGGQHDAGAQDAVFAQDHQRRAVKRIGRLRTSENGAFVLLVQQCELVGLPGQPRVELLQADDIGIMVADQLQHVSHAAESVLAVESPHVIGHHLEGAAVVPLVAVITAELRSVEKRHLEKPDDHQRDHDSGPHQPPADDPIERQHNRDDIDRRCGQPQHGEEPHPARIDVGDEKGDDHRNGRYGRQERHQQIEQPQQQTAPRLTAAVAVITAVIGLGHRVRNGLCPAVSTIEAAGSPTTCLPHGRNAPHCPRRASPRTVRSHRR